MRVSLDGVQLVGGHAPPRELLYTDVGISFWGGVDPLTANVCDHTHPLFGRCVGGKILAVPNGRGSCTGSQVVLEVLLNGIAPAAIVLRQPDAILALGVIVAEELFGVSIPIVSIGAAGFDAIADATHAAVSGSLVVGASSVIDVQAGLDAMRAEELSAALSADEVRREGLPEPHTM